MLKHLPKFIAILVILALLPLSVLAADNSLAVFLAPQEEPLAGVTFRVYPVDSGVSDAQSAYQALLTGKIQPAGTAVTDANGVAQFSGLADGTYLLMGDPVAMGTKTLRPEMCLVVLPAGNDRDVDIFPKFSLTDKQESLEYKLVKIWNDKDNPDIRPDSLQVDLYRNGEKTETVTLNAAGNWRCSWTETDDTAIWAVVEQIPEGYTPEYRAEGNTFYIENTAKPGQTESEPTVPTDEPDDPKLPQTGQLWWPVPILALAGLALILLGVLRRKESSYES